MRSVCVVLLLAAVASAAVVESNFYPGLASQKLSDTEEFKNVVDYLNENASGNDIYDLIESFSDILDDVSILDEARSLSSAVHEVINEIPWAKVNQYIQAKLATQPKFAKLYAMVNDPRFRQLINDVVSSQAVRGFLHSVETKGFTWPAFVNFALKAVCETAIVSHNDEYTEGVCQTLRKL